MKGQALWMAICQKLSKFDRTRGVNYALMDQSISFAVFNFLMVTTNNYKVLYLDKVL